MRLELDGVKVQLVNPDLDGDGEVGGTELVERNFNDDDGVVPFSNPTELKETLEQLNMDVVERGTRMSGIDMRARLRDIEVNLITAFDALVGLRVIPPECLNFTRQKKRLSVSLKGKGRDEIVRIAEGKREYDKDSLGAKVGGLLGFQNNK